METRTVVVTFPQGAPRGGLTLVEALITVVIVGTMLVAAVGLVGAAAQARLIQAEQSRRAALAEELMTEILQCRYLEPGLVESQVLDDGKGGTEPLGECPEHAPEPTFGPEEDETDGTRANFDDVDDYYGWVASPPQAKGGTPYADHAGWTREVGLTVALPGNPETVSPTGDQGLKRITVTVTDPQGKQTTLVALRSSFSPDDEFPEETVTLVDWVGLDLQIGADPQGKLQTGINLRDRVIVATEGPSTGAYLLGAPFASE